MLISVITPSYNQGQFIERTLRAVLGQEGDFELEYIVMDGGSTDDTLDILKKYESHLTIVSEKDEGQSDALNKGFALAKGDMLGWLNSDDVYEPGAFQAIVEEYKRKPFEFCYGDCRVIDADDQEIRKFITRYKIRQSRKYSLGRLLRRNFISQPASMFTKKCWEEIGDIDITMPLSMDYEYFLRIALKYEPRYIPHYLAGFRWHSQSKSGSTYDDAAWVAYECAKKFAPPGHRADVFMHYLHYHALRILYRILE